ncbi:hypothetical protein [Hansschlegelia zhihuaiae]|uniref:Uncharacterized protein n=1 Tax=Hansschlegelia zhihuaiae TaxID=405005 RepID=A0A4Q0MF48_9HYPH|nr:hypothetical protein [Hansschlegelia zhihuaiae]RXF72088.1 hypothetical protein EK403_14865 [Hansschlegelia zhihuaiae]
MLCTTRTPRRRVRQVSTLDAMTESLRGLRARQDCVTEDDLKREGFTSAELAAHGEEARARVRRLEHAQAH